MCRTVGRLGRKKKKARGAQWEGEREKIFPSSPALFLWIPSGSLCVGKGVYYAFHLGPSSSIFVLEFSYHLHESEQVLVCPSTATLKTNHPCFLFFLFSLISMLCYYPRSFKHTTSAQQFKSFLHAHYWPVCTRPPPLRKNRGRDILFLRGGGVRIRLAHCKTRLSFYIGQLSYTCSTFLLRTPFTSFIYIFFRQILIIDIVG